MECTVLKGIFFFILNGSFGLQVGPTQGEVLWIPSDGMIQPRAQVS